VVDAIAEAVRQHSVVHPFAATFDLSDVAIPASRAWLYVEIVGVGYIVSRGLAKARRWGRPADAGLLSLLLDGRDQQPKHWSGVLSAMTLLVDVSGSFRM
jgi:hypothetical protein